MCEKRQTSGNIHDRYVHMKRCMASQGRMKNRKEHCGQRKQWIIEAVDTSDYRTRQMAEREQASLDRYKNGLVYNGNMGHLKESCLLLEENYACERKVAAIGVRAEELEKERRRVKDQTRMFTGG